MSTATPQKVLTPKYDPLPLTPVDLKPRITVIGVGGAGGNAVNNMIRSKLSGVEFVVCNTDAQALHQSLSENRIQLGLEITQGLGAGSRPEVGRAAAEETINEIQHLLKGSNMVFITAGMGGGTGTGAAPVLARLTRELGILTIGVVTKPFHFEGAHRMQTADQGIEELQKFVDTLIVIPNQNLFRIANERTTFAEAFNLADDVLYSGVRGVTDLMIMPGLINLDFADIRAVMSEMGKAMMGTGEAEGGNRAIEAAEAAISNPLLDDVSMKGARGVLINITGGYDMTLFEVDQAADRIRSEVDPNANIIFGSTFEETLNGKMRISVVATGIGNPSSSHHALMSPLGLSSSKSQEVRMGTGEGRGQREEGETSGSKSSSIPAISIDLSQETKKPKAPEPSSTVQKAPERRLSFFERVTGVVRQRPEPAPSPVAVVKEEAPETRAEEGSSSAGPRALPEKSGAGTGSNDSLDIPAFLRR